MTQPDASIDRFGITTGGTPVEAVRLQAGELTVRLLTLGAILQGVRLAGVAHDLTLGGASVADYEGAMRYHGAIAGPVANRISGAAATIAGFLCRFDANEGGRTTLHGGATGTHAQVWRLADAGRDAATLVLDLPDGMGGFPGNRRLTARWQVEGPATLRLTLDAETDAPTLMNLAQHSYWNLDGSADWTGHRLRIDAERVLPTRADATPQGAILPVGGTPFDLRRLHPIVPGAPVLDHNFCTAEARGALRDVALLQGRTGLSMTIATTEPGLQVYDGRAARRPGRGPYEGLAFEPQFWPDAPANPAFPSILLEPGQVWRQVTEWRFARG